MAHFAAAAAPPSSASDPSYSAAAFWTACPSCCYVHSYPRVYLGRRVLCPTPSCRRPFAAAELPAPPPTVPGTDMYFCSWAFFPLGPPSVPDGWAPFTPFNPPPSPAPTAAGAGPTSRKKVGVCLRGRARAEEEAAAADLDAEAEAAERAEEVSRFKGDININEAVELSDLGFRVDEIGFLNEMP